MAKHDIHWYLERLDGVEGDDESGIAWCPCHDDEGSSRKGLSYTVRSSGKILMNCHSPQCAATLTRVTKSLEERENGFEHEEVPDIRVRKTPSRNGRAADGMSWWVEKTGVSAKTWEGMGCVADGAGVRFEFAGHNAYKKRAPDKMSWVGAKEGETPPLWPAPDDEMPKKVFLTEGESDAGTIQESGLGRAHACTKGAKTPLSTSSFQALRERGVEEVVLCGDADDSGREFNARLSRFALGAGLSVSALDLTTVLDPFSGLNDLNGIWRECGRKRKTFRDLVNRATKRLATQIRFKTVDEMEQEAEREIAWLIPDLIAPGDKILISAPQKSLKSWLALELSRALATCSPFLKRAEWTPERSLKIGFIQEEGAPSLWARRIHMLRISGNPNAFFSHRTGFRFTESSFTDELIAAAGEMELDMLVFDPLQRMIPGINENDAAEMGVIWDEIFRIQQAIPGLVATVVHHANKDSTLSWTSSRGSSRNAGEVDLGIFIEKHPIEENTLRMNMDGRDIPQYLGTGEVFEVGYTIDREERLFEMDAREIVVNVTSPGQMKGSQNRALVLKAIEDGCDTRTKIMHEVQLSDTTVIEHLKALIEDDLIDEFDNGKGQAKTYNVREDDNASG